MQCVKFFESFSFRKMNFNHIARKVHKIGNVRHCCTSKWTFMTHLCGQLSSENVGQKVRPK